MKKIKLIPLMMVAPLLVACNNGGVKSLKKPSFAKYSNKVSEISDFYDHFEDAGEEALKANFVFNGDTLVSLDKGASISLKSYQEINYSATLKTGNKQSYKGKQYGERKAEYDASALAAKMVQEQATEAKASGVEGAPTVTIQDVGSQKVAFLASLPSYAKMTIDSSSSGKVETYGFFKDGKQVQASVDNKTYTIGELQFDADQQKKLLAYGAEEDIMDIAQGTVPANGEIVYDRYEDGKVFTSAYTVEASGVTVTYSSGKQFQVTSKVERIYQADFSKMKFLTSEEITVEMKSDKDGQFKYSSKVYTAAEGVNKKVSVKAPDLAKYKEVKASY